MKNKPAFPDYQILYDRDGENYSPEILRTLGGMTLREYYAGLAMQGLISDIKFDEEYSERELAVDAVSLADALIEELSK